MQFRFINSSQGVERLFVKAHLISHSICISIGNYIYIIYRILVRDYQRQKSDNDKLFGSLGTKY